MSKRVNLEDVSEVDLYRIKKWYVGGEIRDSGFRLKQFLEDAGSLALLCYHNLEKRKDSKDATFDQLVMEEHIKTLGLYLRYLLRNTLEGRFIRKHLNPQYDSVRWGCQIFGLGRVSYSDNPYSVLCSKKRDCVYPPYMITDGGEMSFFLRISSLGSLAFMYVDLCRRSKLSIVDPLVHSLVKIHEWISIRNNIAELNFGTSEIYLPHMFKHDDDRYKTLAWKRWNTFRKSTAKVKGF